MRLKEIENRLKEIEAELKANAEGIDIDALATEIEELQTERSAILAAQETRQELLDRIATGQIETRIIGHQLPVDPVVTYNYESPEYRTAFLKTLLGQELTEVEQRAYTHTTSNTAAVVPKETQNKIYSNMEESHPILADVNYLRSGASITIVKHIAIAAGDAANVNEGEANEDEKNTFVNVTLSGKDFSKHIDFSYRLGKMAIPAFEAYLVKEIGDRLGAVLAADTISQIKSDLNSDNKNNVTTAGTLVFDDVTKAFGLLKAVGTINVYANNKTIFGSIVGLPGEQGRDAFVHDYSNGISGRLFGSAIKREDAMSDGEVLILDPNQYLLNEVQGVLIERDKDIKKHINTLAGLIIAEGTMTNDKAGALITIGSATTDIDVTISSVEQVGGTSGSVDSTGIKITFDKDVEGLTAEHITLTNGTGSAIKGTLSGSNKIWTLGITSPSEGSVSVKVSGLTGYKFPTTASNVTIYSAAQGG
ncbi:MAG: phage major capsid protein [Saccharofermentanales bacterium]